uniref:Uncharacterized protein n=1 Tax=Eutreptiella gymnastica TaxID=73025 RepID=A0A7S4G335_9EUGL
MGQDGVSAAHAAGPQSSVIGSPQPFATQKSHAIGGVGKWDGAAQQTRWSLHRTVPSVGLVCVAPRSHERDCPQRVLRAGERAPRKAVRMQMPFWGKCFGEHVHPWDSGGESAAAALGCGRHAAPPQ